MSAKESQSLGGASLPQKRHQSDEVLAKQQLAQDLVHWFTQNGGYLSSDVQIAYSSSRGYHVQAARPLSSPVVVTCPLKLTLSCLNLDPQQTEVLHIVSPLQRCQGKIPDHILTYLLLIEQQRKGEKSPWYTYIRCLPGPESTTTPLWFDDKDMAFLAGTSLKPAAEERKREYFEQWEHAVGAMKEAGVALAEEIDFETLLWAATIFTSRAFISTHILPERDTVPILFPVVDILNHSVSAKVEWDFRPHASFFLKLLDGDSFAPGQELFNNYAPKQNDELLLGYGFCLEDNPIEQFPLKLAFPPLLQQYAEETRLFKPENVPFSMTTDFLVTDANKEQHFLRAPGHPFGRYDNCVPYFRGIPPYIVHFFFIQTLLSIDIDITDVNIQRPGVRITLKVLTQLHQAISQRAQTLPLSMPQVPHNDKQAFAKIYRDGQARIIHAVRDELQNALDRLRHGTLMTPDELLAALPNDDQQRFTSGLTKHNVQDEKLTWIFFLILLAAQSHTSTLKSHNPQMYTWLSSLYTSYPLPALEDGIEDVETYTFVDDRLEDFLDEGMDLDAVETPLVRRGTEHVGPRMLMWAMSVVEGESVSFVEDGVVKSGMYAGECGDEGWMYEE